MIALTMEEELSSMRISGASLATSVKEKTENPPCCGGVDVVVVVVLVEVVVAVMVQ